MFLFCWERGLHLVPWRVGQHVFVTNSETSREDIASGTSWFSLSRFFVDCLHPTTEHHSALENITSSLPLVTVGKCLQSTHSLPTFFISFNGLLLSFFSFQLVDTLVLTLTSATLFFLPARHSFQRPLHNRCGVLLVHHRAHNLLPVGQRHHCVRTLRCHNDL